MEIQKNLKYLNKCLRVVGNEPTWRINLTQARKFQPRKNKFLPNRFLLLS